MMLITLISKITLLILPIIFPCFTEAYLNYHNHPASQARRRFYKYLINV